MKTSELKEIARKDGYESSFTDHKIVLEREGFDFKNTIFINEICESRVWIEVPYCVDNGDMDMMEAAIAYVKTPSPDREGPKRYIVPLPDLTTTGGEQQYPTNKSGHWFACRRNKDLRQTWKEEYLYYVLEQYRGYAAEVGKK